MHERHVLLPHVLGPLLWVVLPAVGDSIEPWPACVHGKLRVSDARKLGSLTGEYQHESSRKRLLTSIDARLTLGAFTDIRRQALTYLDGQRPAIITCDLSPRRDP